MDSYDDDIYINQGIIQRPKPEISETKRNELLTKRI